MKKTSLKKIKFHRRQIVRVFWYEIKKKRQHQNEKNKALPSRIKRRRSVKYVNNPDKAKHETFIAPSTFSLTKNPDDVIQYFLKAKQTFVEGSPGYFDLSEITEMGPETLTYLCAIISDEEFLNDNAISGNLPNDPGLQTMFRNAGFYKFVTSRYDRRNYSSDVNGEIHKITRELVEPEVAGKICESAMTHTFNGGNPKEDVYKRQALSGPPGKYDRKVETQRNWRGDTQLVDHVV